MALGAVSGGRARRRHLGRGAVQLRLAGDDVQDAADRTGAVERSLRSAEHFHPVDVHQPQVGIGRVVGDADVVQVDRHGRLGAAGEGAVRQAAEEDLVPARPEVGHAQPRHLRHKVVDVERPMGGQLARTDHADRIGGPVEQGGAARGGDHDLLHRRRRGEHRRRRRAPRVRRARGCRLGEGARGGSGGFVAGRADDADGAGVYDLEGAACAGEQPGQRFLQHQVADHGVGLWTAGRGRAEADGGAGLDSEFKQRGDQRTRGNIEPSTRRPGRGVRRKRQRGHEGEARQGGQGRRRRCRSPAFRQDAVLVNPVRSGTLA